MRGKVGEREDKIYCQMKIRSGQNIKNTLKEKFKSLVTARYSQRSLKIDEKKKFLISAFHNQEIQEMRFFRWAYQCATHLQIWVPVAKLDLEKGGWHWYKICSRDPFTSGREGSSGREIKLQSLYSKGDNMKKQSTLLNGFWLFADSFEQRYMYYVQRSEVKL